jgi:hypothetical protein
MDRAMLKQTAAARHAKTTNVPWKRGGMTEKTFRAVVNSLMRRVCGRKQHKNLQAQQALVFCNN